MHINQDSLTVILLHNNY